MSVAIHTEDPLCHGIVYAATKKSHVPYLERKCLISELIFSGVHKHGT